MTTWCHPGVAHLSIEALAHGPLAVEDGGLGPGLPAGGAPPRARRPALHLLAAVAALAGALVGRGRPVLLDERGAALLDGGDTLPGGAIAGYLAGIESSSRLLPALLGGRRAVGLLLH